MVKYILTAAALCGLLVLLTLPLPRKERNRMQAVAATAFFALVMLGHESTVLVA